MSRVYFEGRDGDCTSYRRSEDTKLTERRFNAVLACADIAKAQADAMAFEKSVDRAGKALGYFSTIAAQFPHSLTDGKDAYRLLHAHDVAAEIRSLAADMLICAALLVDSWMVRQFVNTARSLNATADRIDTERAKGEAAVLFREQPDQRFLAASTKAGSLAYSLGEKEAQQAVHALKQGWKGNRHTNDHSDDITRLTDRVNDSYAVAADLAEKHGFDIDALDAELGERHSNGFRSEIGDYLRNAAEWHTREDKAADFLAHDALFIARLNVLTAEHGVFDYHWNWNGDKTDGDKAARLAQFKADLPIVEARSGRVIDATAASRKAGELTLTADLAEKHGGNAEWIAGLRVAAGMDRQLAADLLEEVAEIDRAAAEAKEAARLAREAQEVADAARLAQEEAETQAAEEADQFAEAA
jgi:hypothetical protein